MKKLLAGLLLLLAATSAAAQSGVSVKQSGNVTPNQVPWWVTAGVIGGNASSADSPITSFGVTNAGGNGICVNSARITAAGRNTFCLGFDSNTGNATLALQNYGTASPANLSIVVNGTAIPYPAGGANIPAIPGGRLSLSNSLAVTETDIVGAAAIYVMPSGALQTSIYNGTNFIPRTYVTASPIVLDASGATANTNYDVFECWSGTAVVYGFGPSWNIGGGSNTGRGAGAGSTAVDTTVGGRLTNSNAVSIRNNSVSSSAFPANQCNLMGSFRTTIAGATEDSFAKRFLSNLYNATLRPMRAYDTATSWTYSTATTRQANANTGNQLAYLHTVAGRSIYSTVSVLVQNNDATIRNVETLIGIDSTTLASGLTNAIGIDTRISISSALYNGFPGVGYHFITWLEQGAGAGTQTWTSNGGITAFITGTTLN